MRLTRVLALAAFLLTPAALAGGAPPPRPVEAAVVQTGQAPCGITSRGRELWIGVYEAGTILRVDAGGRVTKRVAVGLWPCRVAVGPAALWVTRDRAGELVRISLGSGRRKRVQVGTGAFDVLLARGSVWATSYDVGTVARLEPRNGRLQFVSRVGANPAGLASCGQLIWVGHGRAATWLTAIDPTTMAVRRVDVGARSPGWPRCVRGELWVTTLDSVLRVDARTGVVRARVRLGGTPAEAAAAPDGLVWVTDKERNLVHRVDPDTNELLDAFPGGPGAFSLARVGDSMWITSFAGSDVRRYRP